MHPRTKTVTVKQMRKFMHRQKEIEQEFERLDKECTKVYTRYCQQLADLEFQIKIAESVTDFWGSVPVGIKPYKSHYGKGTEITAYGNNLKILRQADIYPNAHTSKNGKAKHWHINIQVWTDDGTPVFNGGKAYLLNALSIEEAVPIIKEFIQNGTLPKEE